MDFDQCAIGSPVGRAQPLREHEDSALDKVSTDVFSSSVNVDISSSVNINGTESPAACRATEMFEDDADQIPRQGPPATNQN